MTFNPFQALIPESRLHCDAMLCEYTTMRTGGPADYLIEAASIQEIQHILSICQAEGLPLLVLGNGSNLLFPDAGYRGVILHIGKHFSEVSCAKDRICCEAGAMLSAAAHAASDHALTGLEFASGIPGSVGGAVFMNAGAYGGEINQVLENAQVLVNDHVEEWPAERFDFGYRHSAVMENNGIVLSAVFHVLPGDRNAILSTMRDLNARRREKQPLQYPSCGSFFKRPTGHFAGALIEQAGLKGFAIGDAQVSELHAGFIINRGHATSKQIFDLMRYVQQTVYQQFGMMLEPEVRLIGSFEA